MYSFFHLGGGQMSDTLLEFLPETSNAVTAAHGFSWVVSFFQDETTSPNHRHQEISPEEKGNNP